MGTAGKLISTGIALGVAHVLTGPDHISAIVTLSANLSRRDAFGLGIRWGIGHSTGLLVVGIILILI
jgi:high-affinity nickel permease